MNPTWTILGTTAILCLSLAYVTRSGLQRAQLDLDRASLEFERMTSVLREQSTSSTTASQEDRRMLLAFLEASQAQAREHRESVQAMMTATTSTALGIVSPPPPPPSPTERAIAEALAREPWDQYQSPTERQEDQEVSRMQAQPMGWASGPVDPFSPENMPDDVPGPIEGTMQMPGESAGDLLG